MVACQLDSRFGTRLYSLRFPTMLVDNGCIGPRERQTNTTSLDPSGTEMGNLVGRDKP